MFFSYGGNIYFRDEDGLDYLIRKEGDELIISSTSTDKVEGIYRVFDPDEMKRKTHTTAILREIVEEEFVEDSGESEEDGSDEEVVVPKKRGRPATKIEVE